MTENPLYHRLLEQSWRRPLTEAEERELRAWLADHPEAQADWEAEAGLNEALEKLPAAPVATNFTARVLQAIDLEEAGAARGSRSDAGRRHWWPGWLPRVGLASLLLGIGLFSYHQVLAARRAELARSVATVCGVPSLPGPEILRDFDAVWALDPAPPADEELLILFK